MRSIYLRFLYWPVMKLMHRFDLHYCPPHEIEGDIVLRCNWCGLRYTKSRRGDKTFTNMLIAHSDRFAKARIAEAFPRGMGNDFVDPETLPHDPPSGKPFAVGPGIKALVHGEKVSCACVHHDDFECARIRDGRNCDDPYYVRRRCECVCHSEQRENDEDETGG